MYRNSFLILVYSLLLILVAISSQARPLTTEQRLQDFRQLVSLMSAEYGPLEYKKNQNIADLDVLAKKFESQILATKSNQEFYNEIFQFVASFQDGHYAVRAPTTRAYSVPFQADLIENKALISFIDRKNLSIEKFNFELGDEIISIDGQKTEDYIQATLPFIGTGNPKASRNYAVWTMTSRRGSRIRPPLSSKVTYEIRRGLSNIVEKVELEWVVTGKATDEDETLALTARFAKNSKKPTPFVNFDLLLNTNLEWAGPNADRRYMCNSTSRVQIPKDAKVILDKPFTAYIYQTKKGPVGFLRIPHYYPTDDKGNFSEESARLWFEQYRYAISIFEKETRGLVIDQDHNCGGSVELVEDMLSLFVNKTFPAQPFRLRANKGTYLELSDEIEKLNEKTLSYQIWLEILNAVEYAWKKTNNTLTEMVTVTGRKWVFPDREANYTQPILVLIDENAGSGGDAFPSMIKGLGRARLFGQKTGGLGGSVGQYPSLFHSRMSINMTATQFYKPDATPVENNGADPDITYTITRDDFLYGFKNYQKAYTEEIESMIGTDSP